VCDVLTASQENYGLLLDEFAPAAAVANKNVRSAWASLLVNLSLLLTTELVDDSDGRAVAMSALAELLSACPNDDSEATYRW
jgi:hypothetical protein